MHESHQESWSADSKGSDPVKEGEADEVMYPASHPDSLPKEPPGRGGYDDRDPAKGMPRVPTAPETQD